MKGWRYCENTLRNAAYLAFASAAYLVCITAEHMSHGRPRTYVGISGGIPVPIEDVCKYREA
jgi:hypothetical protein